MDDSKALIAAIGVAYLWIAVRQFMKDDPWVALMFVGYAFSQWAIWHQAK
jgi:hypothetical protein